MTLWEDGVVPSAGMMVFSICSDLIFVWATYSLFKNWNQKDFRFPWLHKMMPLIFFVSYLCAGVGKFIGPYRVRGILLFLIGIALCLAQKYIRKSLGKTNNQHTGTAKPETP